jgi:hypothetical protein
MSCRFGNEPRIKFRLCMDGAMHSCSCAVGSFTGNRESPGHEPLTSPKGITPKAFGNTSPIGRSRAIAQTAGARGLMVGPGHNPGCSRLPGPTGKRAHAHQGSNDLRADGATTLSYESGSISRGSATPVGTHKSVRGEICSTLATDAFFLSAHGDRNLPMLQLPATLKSGHIPGSSANSIAS